MLTVDDLRELGFTVGPRPELDPTPTAEEGDLPRLERLSGPSRALHAVWAGERVVCLEAPPGSGKSSAIVDLLAHLVMRLGLNVTVGCPTRAQATLLGGRLYRKLPGGYFQLSVSGPELKTLGPDVIAATRKADQHAGVTIKTLAAAQMRPEECDLFVVDEAYQATFADVAAAAAKANQLLLVGDPGQIGPVVTVDTTVWDAMSMAPHSRAMHVFRRREDAVTFSIDRTYRLGPVTTAIIGPLYTFKFDSRRPARHITTGAGRMLPEIGTMPLGTPSSPDDHVMLLRIADWAEELCHAVLHDGDGSTRNMTPYDVAVVVARNSQGAFLDANLASRNLPGITVGTADKLQGGEWAAVVAVDACAGNTEPNDYLTSLGRLCVMASRHATHLTWCVADGWLPLLEASDMSARDRRTAVTVRTGMASQPVVVPLVVA